MEPLEILIIEDNPGDLLLLKQYLSLSDIRVARILEAGSAAVGCQMLYKHRPHLVFVDLFLPDSKGLETFLHIKELALSMPVVVLSGLDDADTALKAIQAGAQDYMIKGEFDEKMLAKTITYSIERKKIQESLNNSLQVHELVGEATNDVIWDWDLKTQRVSNLSKAIESNYGYHSTQIGATADWWHQKIHPADVEQLCTHFKCTIAAGEPYLAHEFRFRRSGGDYLNVYARAQIIYRKSPSGTNTAYRIIGVLQDVTDLKKAREKLDWSIQRYETISRATSDIIYDWDITGDRMIFSRDDIKKLCGYGGIEETSSQWWYDHLHPDDRRRVETQIKNHLRNKTSQLLCEYRFRCADGTYKNIYGRSYSFYNEAMEPYRMIGAMQDITHMKQLQEKVLNEKMIRQQKITEATISSQEREREELGKELHDNINQILATCKMFIDMANKNETLREELLPKSFTYLTLAIEEIRKLSKSLVPPSLGDIGLEEAIGELLDTTALGSKTKYNFASDLIGRLKLPNHLQLLIYRIVQEQLNNISKYACAANVSVALYADDSQLRIRITDDGVGFDSTKRVSGIGLRNMKSRTHLHGGKMKIDSQPNKGCTLSVSIPLKGSKKKAKNYYE